MAIHATMNSGAGVHQKFYNGLTSSNDSLALSQLWLCGFNEQHINRVKSYVKIWANKWEVSSWNQWRESTMSVIDKVLDDKSGKYYPFNGFKSGGKIYLFVKGVSFVADGFNAARQGPTGYYGATKGVIGNGRLDLNATNITFLESNISFVDAFLRPWSMVAANESMKKLEVRCDIELFALQKWSQRQPLKIRKVMLLRNATPISIDAEEYNYTGDKLVDRQIQFAFDRYESHVVATRDDSVTTYDPADLIRSSPHINPDMSSTNWINNLNFILANKFPNVAGGDAKVKADTKYKADATSAKLNNTAPDDKPVRAQEVDREPEDAGVKGQESIAQSKDKPVTGQEIAEGSRDKEVIGQETTTGSIDIPTQAQVSPDQGQEGVTIEDADFEESLFDNSLDSSDRTQQFLQEVSARTSNVGNALDAAEGILAQVNIQSQDLASSTARLAKSVGADDFANDVLTFQRDVSQKYIYPVADVIGTGQQITGAVGNLGSTLADITGTGIYQSNQGDINRISDALNRK